MASNPEMGPTTTVAEEVLQEEDNVATRAVAFHQEPDIEEKTRPKGEQDRPARALY
jgi:hypothetical protein